MDLRPDLPADSTRCRSARGAASARAGAVLLALLVLLLAGLGDSSGIVTGAGVVTPAPMSRSSDTELRRDGHDDDRAATLSLHHTAMQARGALGSRIMFVLAVGLMLLGLLGRRASVARRVHCLVVPVERFAPARPPSIGATAWTSRGPPARAL